MKNKMNISTKPVSVHTFLEKKVAGPECVAVSLEELIPSAFATTRAGVQAIVLEDLDDRRTADLADAQLLQLTEDADVAPSVLSCQSQHEVADILECFRPARSGPFTAFRRHRFAVEPAGEGAGRGDSDQRADGLAQRLAILEEPLPLYRGNGDLLGQLIAENAVLGLEVLNLSGQLAVGGVGQQ
jgi:hypothetical protein